MHVELPALRLHTVVAVQAAQELVLINRDPAPDETGVPRTSSVSFEISVFDGSQVVDSTLFIEIDGAWIYDGSRTDRVQPGASVDLQPLAQGLHVRVARGLPFDSQASVGVRVVAETSSGARLDVRYTFTIEDRTAPRVVAAQAQGPRQVRVLFDEPVQVGQPTNFELVALERPAVTPQVIEVEPSGRTSLDLLLSSELTPGVSYEVAVSGIVDYNANAVMAPFDRARFVGFVPHRPERRRFDLWSMLPVINRREDVTGDLRRFVACLQEITDLLLADIDGFTSIFDLDRASSPWLDLLLADLGNPFVFELDVDSKRRLAASLVEMYRYQGTARGLIDAARFFLGFEITVEPFANTSLILGVSELGLDWELGTDDRFFRYAFNVRVERLLEARERNQLRVLIETLKPAHTHLVDVIEPLPPPADDSWILGEGVFGVSTVLSE